MMPLLLGHRAHSVDERERALEVGEPEGLAEVVALRRLPALHLLQIAGHRVETQRGDSAAAGHTFLIRKIHRAPQLSDFLSSRSAKMRPRFMYGKWRGS